MFSFVLVSFSLVRGASFWFLLFPVILSHILSHNRKSKGFSSFGPQQAFFNQKKTDIKYRKNILTDI